MAGAFGVEVIYDPDGANVDIAPYIVFRTAKLTSSLATLPGSWQCTVKDVDRALDFTTGKRVIWKLDGQSFYGGFLTQVSRTYAFPVVDTTTIGNVKARQFVLRGVDYNILFDKRVMHNNADHLNKIPNHDEAWDSTLIAYACDNYLNLPSWLNTTAEVAAIMRLPRPNDKYKKFHWTTQGNTWRKQMDVISQLTGAVYYIRPSGDTNARLVYKAQEDSVYPYAFSDKPSGSDIGIREIDYMEDGSGIVNDALVWGGDEFGSAVSGDPVVFGREKNDSSIADHHRWQWAEQHFGDSLYANETAVQERAEAIVSGKTGDVIYEKNRGLQRPNKTYSITWFSSGVPKPGANYDFIMPGELATLELNVFNETVVLPCRQVAISFLTNDQTGDSYIRFDGSFSLQVNDPWQLWLAVRRRQRAIT